MITYISFITPCTSIFIAFITHIYKRIKENNNEKNEMIKQIIKLECEMKILNTKFETLEKQCTY